MGTKNIKKDTSLRKAILQAAITGQLAISNVQCAISETGKELLDRIIAERNAKALVEWEEELSHRLDFANAKSEKNKQKSETALAVSNPCDNKKTRTKKPAPIVASEIDADEIPFEIPENWCWCRIDDLFAHNSGKALNKSENKEGTELEYITTSNLYWNYFDLDNLRTMLFKDSEIEKCTVRKGDLLVCEGGEVGRTAIWNFDRTICIQNHIHRLRAYEASLNIKFYYYVLFLYKEGKIIDNYAKGIGIKGLSSNALGSIVIPLPPLAEQNAIAAKLEEVLPLVEIYENAVLQKEELKNTLSDKVRKAILQEAVTGQLGISSGQLEISNVQCAISETGKELLQRIIAERNAKALTEWEEKVKVNAKAKKPAPIVASEIYADEIPFEIPESWCLCRLGDVGDFVRGKGFVKSDFVENGFPCIHYGQIHMKFGYETEHEITYIPNEVAKKSSIAQTNDIIIAITSEDELASCKATVWKGEYNIAVGSHTAIYHQYVNPSYIIYYLFSNIFYSQKIKYTHGSKVVEIKPSDIASCLIPLPPLAEQEAIVAKIEQLLPLCKQLEN